MRPGKSNKEEWVVRRNIRNKNELDKIGDEENPENYNDTENPVVEERITTTADDSENKLENEHYTVLIHEEATEEEKKTLNRLLEVMRDQKRGYVCDFKKVDRQKLQQETAKINRVLKYIKTNNITETNKLIKGVSIVVAENLGIKVDRQNDMGTRQRGKNQEPWWKRRIQSDIKKIQSEISILQRKERAELRTDSKYTRLKEKYNIRRKGTEVVMEELKQRLKAKRPKVIRYEQRVKQYRQNKLFISDQKRFYQEINGNTAAEKLIPNAQESQDLGKEEKHNLNADWLKDLKESASYPQQEQVQITKEKVCTHSKKVANWKAAGPDGVQGYWIKKLCVMNR